MGKRLGMARFQALLENLKRELNLNGSTLQGIGGYSSTDVWGQVRPSFLPGIDRGVRSFAFGQMHGYGIEDAGDIAADNANTTIWVRDTDNSATIALVSNDADFTDGSFTLTTGSSSGNQTGICTRSAPFTCATGKKWWCETSVKLADHDATELFFGMSEVDVDTDSFHLTAAGAGVDRVGFVKSIHTDDTVSVASTKNAGGSILISTDSALEYDTDDDVLTMAIMWDGVDTIKFYAGIAATGSEVGDLSLVKEYSTAAGIPNDSSLKLVLMVEGTGSTACQVNYIRGAIEV